MYFSHGVVFPSTHIHSIPLHVLKGILQPPSGDSWASDAQHILLGHVVSFSLLNFKYYAIISTDFLNPGFNCPSRNSPSSHSNHPSIPKSLPTEWSLSDSGPTSSNVYPLRLGWMRLVQVFFPQTHFKWLLPFSERKTWLSIRPCFISQPLHFSGPWPCTAYNGSWLWNWPYLNVTIYWSQDVSLDTDWQGKDWLSLGLEVSQVR